MRQYSKIALAISAVLCVGVLILTINNVPKYNERTSQETLERETLLKNVLRTGTSDSLLLVVADSILTNTAILNEMSDSIKAKASDIKKEAVAIDRHVKTVQRKLDNTNNSVKDVRLR